MKHLIPCLILFSIAKPAFADISEQDFINPPLESRPDTYWEWMNGNISKDGITKDLEYMKQAGYGAAMIFEAGVGIPQGPVAINSTAWKEAILHAVKEAHRLGLQLSMHNSPGYSGTGGAWIPVEYSMKQLVWTDTYTQPDSTGIIDITLPQPHSKMGFYKDAFILAYPSLPAEKLSFHSLVRKVISTSHTIDDETFSDHNLKSYHRLQRGDSIIFELEKTFDACSATIFRGERETPLDPHDGPRDYAPTLSLETSEDGINYTYIGTFTSTPLRSMDTPYTITFKPLKARFFKIKTNRATNIAEIDFHSSPRLENYPAKTNYATTAVPLKENKQIIDPNQIIHSKQVIDITNKSDSNGQLKWKPPYPARWTIVRIGYTTTGEEIAAAPDTGKGLDCDKFSKTALDKHFDLFLDPLLDTLKPWCGTTLRSLVIDSWEAGKQNWTEELPSYFKRKRHYDIKPYMLAVTGRIIDDIQTTERFLWDFRRTHTDMFIENYVEHFKKRADKYRLKYTGEAYGDGNFESLEMAARQDYPMSEFWTHYIYGNISTTMLAASTAHIWDKPIVACECYTGTPFNSKFTEHPYGMKALGDYIMTAGVNRFVYHATTHQPYTAEQNGNIMTMGPFGTHLDRNSTWATHFKILNLYNARCAYMLQQGKYVADILYLKDEAISSGVNNYNTVYPATPYGYRWDITGTEALLERLSEKDGRIVLPDGMHYDLLVVTPMERTSPETLRRIIQLVKQGMTVMLAGDKPIGYLGLNPTKDQEVKTLADELWNAGEYLGKGRIYYKGNLSDILRQQNICPDFAFTAKNKDAIIHFIHRTVADDEVYFIANQRRRAERLTVTCRVSGKTPQLWNAETGTISAPIDYETQDNTTTLNIDLPESGSIFIVFRDSPKNPESQIKRVVPQSSLRTPIFNTFTLALWAKPETFAANGRGFLLFPDKGENLYGEGHATVGISMGQNGIKVFERSETPVNVLSSDIQIEGWTHLVLVYNNGTPTLYLNGSPVATGQKSRYICSPAHDVPMAEEQFITLFEGDQTPIKYIGHAWSKDEILSDFKKGLPTPDIPEDTHILYDLTDKWQVCFPAWSKAPEKIILPELSSFHKHPDFNIRHFSGTATYLKTFTLHRQDLQEGRQILLDLGRVENIATVSINDNPPVTVWKAPFRIDITDQLKTGTNKLTIEVTNLYPNRIIGDEYLPEKYEYDEYGRIRQLPNWYLDQKPEPDRVRVLFLPWKYYKKTDPLLEAGLLGPVRILIKE